MKSNVFNIIKKEQNRQKENIELIASENFVSNNVRKAVGSICCNKYAEGYPNITINNIGKKGRYYGGCQHIDELENYCRRKWQEVFKTNYHVNVQPHSGSQANMTAYAAVLDPDDTILAMSLDAGGHLTHSSKASFVSRFYNVVTYGLNAEGYIDEKDFCEKIIEYKPKLVVIGASAYSRIINFARFSRLITESAAKAKILCPYMMVDMAHIAGLVAAGFHPSPFMHADIITTTTHKTLRGPRGGIIFCKPHLAEKIDFAVFPFSQGGPLEHVIAGKAVAAEEALDPKFIKYIDQVIKNSKAMAEEFKRLGYKIVSNGTSNHLFLLSLEGTGLTGAQAQELCDKNKITLNKNAIPNDPLPPSQTSGLRIGTAAMTTKGWKEKDFIKCARQIDKILTLK